MYHCQGALGESADQKIRTAWPESGRVRTATYGVSRGAAATPAQPPVTQASQQLGRCPTHDVPCLVALQCAASLLMLQVVFPFAGVRQQVTKPGFPHVERAAQSATARLQDFGKVPAPFATCFAQRTNVP